MAHFFKSKKNKLAPTRVNSRTTKAKPAMILSHNLEDIFIVRLSDDGRGIATHNSKIIFIENALPNEIIDVTIVQEKSKFYEGHAHKIKKKSNYRRLPQCLHFDVCGGCQLQHLDIKQQQDFKLSNVLNKLKHVGQIIPQNVLSTVAGDEFGYRQRVRLSVNITDRKVVLGFRKKSSKDLVEINDCSVMMPVLIAPIARIRHWLNKYQPSVSHIELIASDQHIGLIVRHVLPVSVAIRQKLDELLEDPSIICCFQANKAQALTSVKGHIFKPQLNFTLDLVLAETTKQLIYSYHPQDFIQANAEVNQKMINQALSLLQPSASDTYLDLFCGMGNLSLPLSLSVKYVLGIEGSRNMVHQATSNASSNNCKNINFMEADLFDRHTAERLVESDDLIDGIDGMILDPPRAGAKLICQNIRKLSPKKILYISCDSNTFVRDAQLLIENNYILEHLGILDMFAQTFHSEVMGLFVLKSKAHAKFPKRQIT